MKRSEVAKLFTVIQAAENSGRRPSEADVELWLAFAQEGHWESYDAALRAYVVYRSANPSYPFHPGHITATLEKVRAGSSGTFELSERPPAEVLDAENFDAAYLAWTKAEAAKHRAQHMAAFARGETHGQRAIEA